jgi:hypothetical protein
MTEAETQPSVIRIAENQSTFRDANEQIEQSAEELELGAGLVPFICECPREKCRTVIRMTLEAYNTVRSNPSNFVTAPGHQDISIETGAGRTVDVRDGYVVVEKIGVAGEIAEERAQDR